MGTMPGEHDDHRGDARERLTSLKNWGPPPAAAQAETMKHSVILDCGWGRLIFGQTFENIEDVARALEDETEGRRDVAFYVREPHVVLAVSPQRLFLDPSHTFRLDLVEFGPFRPTADGLATRAARPSDQRAVNRLYLSRGMVPLAAGFCETVEDEGSIELLVVEEERTGELLGVVMGVDHRAAFNDPDGGSSLWALAVDPQAQQPGLGERLVVALANLYRARGRRFLDLSVMHDNRQAIALYEKLGFERVPVYCLKRKNPINERLFLGPPIDDELNIYARIIIDEARRRGIGVSIDDAEAGLFRLTLGGRSIACRESLSDLTSAVALTRCDDKRLTHRLLGKAGLKVPRQIAVDSEAQAIDFLERHDRVVVKPAQGEQGHGVFVDLERADEVAAAVERVRRQHGAVLMEEFVEGQDLRIIVIGGDVVAAAVRRPAQVRGDGKHSIAELIEKQSRRRAAATGGESRIPLDQETERCVQAWGYRLADILPTGQSLPVRKTANLHSGGTIHDVTGELHDSLAEAAVKAAQVLDIPVVGLDFMVAEPGAPQYVIIEANERPGLANHEPQPTAERFIDLLFPQTAAAHLSASGGV